VTAAVWGRLWAIPFMTSRLGQEGVKGGFRWRVLDSEVWRGNLKLIPQAINPRKLSDETNI